MATKRINELYESLEDPFDFLIEREASPQDYTMHTQFIQMGFDGRRKGTEDYWLKLRHTPKETINGNYDECICKEFSISINGEERKRIPTLTNWSYLFDPFSGLGKGRVFGIPHEPFETLEDSEGKTVPPEIKYAIYNNFVDYHALSNTFTRHGAGIEKIKKIGDKIVHSGAYSKAPIELNNIIKEGSIFCNGEITLEFAGVSSIDNTPCAIINYNSGESTFDMEIMTKKGNTKTIGGSQYIGAIYLDLVSGWTQKVTLNEFVVSERKAYDRATEMNYTIRNLQINRI